MFVKRNVSPDQSFTVGLTLGRKAVKGTVGLEIEVEGNKFPKPSNMNGSHTPIQMSAVPPYASPVVMKHWSYVHDGSLRGQDNAEYVLTKPIDFDDVPAALDELYGGLAAYGSVIDNSHRTSTHVHLNVQDFYLNRLTSLMALYVSFEEILTEWCGEHRVGNLFCLRAKDAPYIVSSLRRFIKTNMEAVVKDFHRYAGMNSASLTKLGSLEFRALRGVPGPEAIVKWVGILRRLYEVSEQFTDPRDVCGTFSGYGPQGFFEYILGDQASVVRTGVSMSEDQMAGSLLSGIRMAQDLCYARDWSVFKEIALRPDPFGRDTKKIIRRLVGGSGAQASAGSGGIPINMIQVQPGLLSSGQTLNQVSEFMSAQWASQNTPPEPEYDEPEQDWTQPMQIADFPDPFVNT